MQTARRSTGGKAPPKRRPTGVTKIDKAAKSTKSEPTQQKAKSTKSEPTHPKYAEMIHEAIANIKNRKGSSRIAILKYIKEHYDIHEHFPDQTNQHLRQALKHGVEKGELNQVKGIGSNGSFKLAGPKTSTPKKIVIMAARGTPKKATATKKVDNAKDGKKAQATKKGKVGKK